LEKITVLTEAKKRHITNGNCCAACSAARVPQNRSRAIRPLCGFTPPHFCSPGLACASPYSGCKNVSYLER